jgi:glycerol-3-phosphate dehydrogenase subunit C
MSEDLIISKKVAFYTGCFTNYYYPETGKATIKVLRKNGIQVVVPKQVCCGLPMIAKGNTKRALANMKYNTDILSRLISDGFMVVTTCSSCGLMIKRDYPLFLKSEKAKQLAANLYQITEYLLLLHRRDGLNTDFKNIQQTVFYHTPCHMRAQGIGNPTVKILELIPGTTVKHIGEECCGMGGAYGYEKKNFELSKKIANKLYDDLKETPCDRIVTDCGGCKLQIQAGTGVIVEHPMILLQEAYGL